MAMNTMNGMREPESTRRFFVGAIYGLMGIISAALGIPAAGYLLLPPRTTRKEDWVDVGDIAQLGQSGPQEVVFRRTRKDGWKILSEKTSAWITRKGNELVAFAPGCTHLGCAYHWDEKNKNFLCPCHTSTFGTEGQVLSGPAPRALDRFQTKVNGNRLLLGPVVQGTEVSELHQISRCPKSREA
jgi:menaquinol-cytochrome c reductase iron-sulfur subunit